MTHAATRNRYIMRSLLPAVLASSIRGTSLSFVHSFLTGINHDREPLLRGNSVKSESYSYFERNGGCNTQYSDDDFIRRDIEENTSSFPWEHMTSSTADQRNRNGMVATPNLPICSTTRLDLRPFPISMIIDQNKIKQSLLLAAANPRSIGVLISGGRGTCKSVLARSMQKVVPSHIRRILNNEYNIDPDGQDGIDSFLANSLQRRNEKLQDLETELVNTPFVQIPLGVTEDSLIGTVDLERSLDAGSTIFSPGLLARAHRGILYVDEINLLDDEVADVLLKVLSDGYVEVEREGLSVRYPCKPLIIATYNPEEGELREHLLDRFAIGLSADSTPLSVTERVTAVENVIGFSGGSQVQSTSYAEENLRHAELEEQNLRTKIEMARLQLKEGIRISSKQIRYLCEEATRYGCEGQRAEIFATEIAKASAALDGRNTVDANDLQSAAILAILPRATVLPDEMKEDLLDQTDSATSPDKTEVPKIMEPPPSMPTKGDDQSDQDDKEVSEDEETEAEEQVEEEKDQEDDEDQSDSNPEESVLEIPEVFMSGVANVKVDPQLLKFSKWTRRGKGGRRAKIFSLLRGRFVKSVFPKGKKGKLAVGATLRASAPYQKSRKKRSIGTRKEGRIVIIEKEDFRIKRMSRKAGTLVIFLVDASGSMALNRMNAAKGAAINLLSEAYKSRDKICLIPFHGVRAEVTVPPTKSMTLTKNRLESMPCGGGSPLAHGLSLAMRTGLNTIKVKQDVGRVVIVCITDGRANIPLELSTENKFTPSSDPESKEGMPSRKFLKDEVLSCSKKLAALHDFDFVCIDTEDTFVGTGMAREMALAAQGKYHHLDSTDSVEVAKITRQSLR